MFDAILLNLIWDNSRGIVPLFFYPLWLLRLNRFMPTNTKIFQIYYKPEQKAELDPDFIPYDNTENPKPELREWYVWDKGYEILSKQNIEYWGFLSPKFKHKTNLTGQQVHEFINSNPNYDVYLFNPCIANEAIFLNSWEQGDIHHPNISLIGNTFLKKIGYQNPNVRGAMTDRTNSSLANYIIGSKYFWDKFMTFSRQIFTEAELDKEFNHMVFGEGLSNYSHDLSLPIFPFLLERLVTPFFHMSQMKVMSYRHTEQTLHSKYNPYIAELNALGDLKVLANKYSSHELLNVWLFYRNQFISTHGLDILMLE
jgi:hypothetical protein